MLLVCYCILVKTAPQWYRNDINHNATNSYWDVLTPWQLDALAFFENAVVDSCCTRLWNRIAGTVASLWIWIPFDPSRTYRLLCIEIVFGQLIVFLPPPGLPSIGDQNTFCFHCDAGDPALPKNFAFDLHKSLFLDEYIRKSSIVLVWKSMYTG